MIIRSSKSLASLHNHRAFNPPKLYTKKVLTDPRIGSNIKEQLEFNFN
jgi:hypothetical protein